MTEHPMHGDPLVNATRRCAPANVMAAALMQGTATLARVVAHFRASDSVKNFASGLKRELLQFEDSLRRQMVSYEQLSRVQDLLYGAENAEAEAEHVFRLALSASDERDSEALLRFQERLRHGELQAEEAQALQTTLMRALGGEPVLVRASSDSGERRSEGSHYSIVLHPSASAVRLSVPADSDLQRLLSACGLDIARQPLEPRLSSLGTLLAALVVGQTAFVRLGLNESSTSADHFITLGRSTSGEAFVYNSAPSEDDFTLYCGTAEASQAADFEAQLHRSARRLVREVDGSVPWVTVVQW